MGAVPAAALGPYRYGTREGIVTCPHETNATGLRQSPVRGNLTHAKMLVYATLAAQTASRVRFAAHRGEHEK